MRPSAYAIPLFGREGHDFFLSRSFRNSKYVDVFDNFPAECRYALETLRDVYRNDAITHDEKMSPDERLEFHKQHSKPPMTELEKWLHKQFDENLVEPNSTLAEPIGYMLSQLVRADSILGRARRAARQQHLRACVEESERPPQ